MEFSCMADKILRLIEKILDKNLNLSDFAIIPTEDNTQNRSPVILQDNHLGLESWCIKYIYQYACSELFKVRKLLAEKRLGYHKMINLNYLLVGALFVNPDVGTFWNMRRELVEADILSYSGELRFSQLVLTRKSKSNETFSYRRWLLTRITEKMKRNSMEIPRTFLDTELQITLDAAGNAQNNYHAWNHRIFSMENLSEFSAQILENELVFSERWISHHVSENSGYHYRQYVIELAKKHLSTSILQNYYLKVLQKLNVMSDLDVREFGPFVNFLLGANPNTSMEDNLSLVNYISVLLYDLFVTIENINQSFVDHESLWLYRRYVIFSLLKTAHEYHNLKFITPKNLSSLRLGDIKDNIVNISESGEKLPKIFKSQPNKVEFSNLYKTICKAEKEFISCNSNSNSLVQVELARRHEKWLKFILNIELS